MLVNKLLVPRGLTFTTANRGEGFGRPWNRVRGIWMFADHPDVMAQKRRYVVEFASSPVSELRPGDTLS